MILLIDDMRNLPADLTCRTYTEGIAALRERGPWSLLLLDHDLGEDRSGYDVICWLEENPEFLPGEIRCVSSNPPGRARIEQVARRLYRGKP